VTKPLFRLGRKEDNDGVVDCTKAVSRYHCEITFIDGRYFIIDLDSKYGTFVKRNQQDGYGDSIHPHTPVPLQSGCFVKLADVEFHVEF